jgi:adenine-specific DNA methylase
MEVEPPDGPSTSAGAGEITLLERGFPFREVSLVAKADRRANDPIYGAHRWWARRPPALLRGLLLAARVPSSVGSEDFWRMYASAVPNLQGWRVHDPFIGGGSTLVEAARLGAMVSGSDVDPLAVAIVRYELEPAPAEAIREAGSQLLEHLRSACGRLYPAEGKSQPLHYFWLHEVTCPNCSVNGMLYRDLVIARDRRKPGAVVRDQPLVVFDPDDLSILELNKADRVEIHRRGRRRRINEGTYRKNRYWCPACGTGSSHKQLATGMAPRRMLAVEETSAGERRLIRPPSSSDRDAVCQAERWVLDAGASLLLPTGELAEQRHDDRPRSYGITNVLDLFTVRQRAVFGAAFAWLRDADLGQSTLAGLQLAMSNALATNNKLCSYAYDYGRLSALFSVRGYSLPALPVELNPLHDSAGRGTLRQCIERVARAGSSSTRRHVWSTATSRPEARTLDLTSNTDTSQVRLASATMRPVGSTESADLCVFDPPYYDYIAYSELSEFYRSWLDLPEPPSTPLLPGGEDPAETFGLELGAALRATLARLARGRPIVFTYHSTSPDAWRAIGIALDEAKVRVTGLFPVYSDGHMGHHSHPGNCEWDLVLVCRRLGETVPVELTASIERWAQEAEPLTIGAADQASINLAISIASTRFGEPSKEP